MSGRPLERTSATRVRVGGRELCFFGGCDYLGLAHHPLVVEAACKTARRGGLSSGGSRATSGTRREHEELEAELARRTGFEEALLVGEGALANLALCEGLAANARRCVLDEAAHVTARSAVRAAGMELESYAHVDPAALRARVEAKGGEPLVAWTDGVYPARATLAPVAELLGALPREGAWLVVDDAHGFGALGERGLGACERLDPRDPRAVVTLTLSKSLGCYGGAVLASGALVAELRAHSPTYLGTTPVPAALASAALVALELALEDGELRARLSANGARMAEHLCSLGWIERAPPLPVFLLPVGGTARGAAWTEALRAAGFHVPLTDYPGDGGPGLRVVVTAAHAAADIDALAEALAATVPPP